MVLSEPSPDPDDEQVNEIFSRMLDDLELTEQNVENIGVVVVSSLSDLELLAKFEQAKQELHSRQEVLLPKTEVGRDLHSIYHACLLEMHKRGLR